MYRLICIVFLFFFTACNKFGTKHVIIIQKLNFGNTITMGDSSDVIFNNLPKNNVTISKSQDGMTVNIKEPVYIKIDNQTQNIFDLNTVDEIEYKGKAITKNQLNTQLNKIYSNRFNGDNQNYLPLRYFFLLFFKNDSIENVKSIIAHEKNQIILLDDDIILTINGVKTRYSHSFSLGKNQCKIELFNPIYYHIYRGNQKNENYLYVDSISGHVKVNSSYNSFGASEFMVSTMSTGMQVEFDKPYIQVVNQYDIKNKINDNNGLPISFVQNFTKSSDANSIDVKSASYGIQSVLAIWHNGEIEKMLPNIIMEKLNIFKLSIFYFPLFLTFIFILFRLNRSLFIITLYDNTLQFNRGDNTMWRPYLKKIFLLIFIFMLIRGLVSYSLFITEPNYHYFLPMQVIIMPFILLLVFNYIHLFNLIYGTSFIRARTINDMGSYLKQEIIYQTIFHIFVFGILFFINYQYFPGILLNQIKFDFNAGLSPFKILINSSLSPLFSLISAYFLLLLIVIEYKWRIVSILVNKFLPCLINIKYKIVKFLPVSLFFILFFSSIFVLKNSYSFLVLLLFIVTNGSIFFDNIYSYTLQIIKRMIPNLKKGIIRKLFSNHLNNIYTILNAMRFTFAKYIISLIFILSIFLIQGDQGYIINFIPLVLALIWLISNLTVDNNTLIYRDDEESRRRLKLMNKISFVGILFVILLFKIYASFSVDMEGRTNARLTAVYDFNNMEDIGLKKTESISQWFVVMGKYVWPSSNVINETEFHSVVSGNSDPIVINDLSFPINMSLLFGRLSILFYVLLIGLWCYFFKHVNKSIFTPQLKYNRDTNMYATLHYITIIKIACLFYFVFSGLWLVMSYWSLTPFTGRLILGLGQDSAAEVLEFCTIMIIFGLTFNKSTKL